LAALQKDLCMLQLPALGFSPDSILATVIAKSNGTLCFVDALVMASFTVAFLGAVDSGPSLSLLKAEPLLFPHIKE
jgi:hypothetical protein